VSEIEARVGVAPENEGLWERLRFWRGLGLVASGACAAFAATTVFLMTQKPALPASYIAVLSDPKTARPMLVVSAGREDATLQMKTLDPSIHVANASLELWAIPKGAPPRSLGLVAAGQGSLRLAAVADQSLADVPMLAVSLEPRGGSPTGAPSGPVLYSGPCVKYW
jgi:anti-sigma-K factor RskA